MVHILHGVRTTLSDAERQSSALVSLLHVPNSMQRNQLRKHKPKQNSQLLTPVSTRHGLSTMNNLLLVCGQLPPFNVKHTTEKPLYKLSTLLYTLYMPTRRRTAKYISWFVDGQNDTSKHYSPNETVK